MHTSLTPTLTLSPNPNPDPDPDPTLTPNPIPDPHPNLNAQQAGWFGLPQATYARFLSAGGAVPANGPLGADPRKNVQANWTLNVEPY